MADRRDVEGILQDLSILYELSLSFGPSLDLVENCDSFLRTLMARKSLDFCSVWIRGASLYEQGDGNEWCQVYSNPGYRSPVSTLDASHPLVRRVERESEFSVSHGADVFEEVVVETGIDQGTFAVYRLGNLGFLKLYSITRSEPFSNLELRKLRNVIDKFTVAVRGCLDHERLQVAEERRRELETQILHTQKLESLGVMAGGIAHDFNNLLTAIIGNAELLQSPRRRGPGATREKVDNILDAARSAADLCSQLLVYSGRSRFITGPVDLNAAVEEMLRLTKVSISKKALVKPELSTSLPALEGDAGQVRQVVMNLLTNASEALEGQAGTLTVRTALVSISESELIEYQLGDGGVPGVFVCLELEDTGCGIEPAELGKLYDPFYTTKFTGRGLGLAAVLGIVRRHRGAIRVQSEPGRGTLVRVAFPVSTSWIQPVARVEPPRALQPLQGTVLVVDDEESIRRVLGDLLEDLGLVVLFAKDGGAALELCAHPAIDLVIMDLTMPVLSGDEAFRRIALLRPEVPVILTSGYSESFAGEQFEGLSPAAFLEKPFRQAKVEEVVRRSLGRSRAKARNTWGSEE